MAPNEPRITYHWHPTIHERWAGEKLIFWRLGFKPTYDRGQIVEGIQRALALHRSTAFTIYELSAGADDVFLRAWLPGSSDDFEAELGTTLGQYGLEVAIDGFYVSRIIAHWAWETAPNALALRPVSDSAPHDPLHHTEIASINTGVIPRARAVRYRRQNLVTPVRRKAGVKFFTVIQKSERLAGPAKQRLEGRIKEVLCNAGSIREKSLYAGSGLGAFLVMGRTRDYFAIERELTRPLNDRVDFARDGVRTETYPTSRQDFLDARYDLKVDGSRVVAQSAVDALTSEESHMLEVKGSALVSYKRWLKGDHQLVRDEKVINGGFLKAVTGLLNADGGTLVIGALERRDFDDEAALADMPRVGAYIIVGIDPDVGGDGWDGYERELRDLMSSRVRPDPNAWVSIHPERVLEHPVAVVEIHPGNRGFYHYPKGPRQSHFWTRQGNRTKELTGPAIEEYLKLKSRLR